MSTRTEIIRDIYSRFDEDVRLLRTRQGQLEYATTMEYIHRFAAEGSTVLEIGAGTGRYSIALAKEGMDVTAVDLLEKNLDILKENSKGIGNLRSFQGEMFTGYDVTEFESMFEKKPVKWITTAALDGPLEPIELRPDFNIPDKDFSSFAAWHLNFAETRELLGASSHLLYCCKKDSSAGADQ